MQSLKYNDSVMAQLDDISKQQTAALCLTWKEWSRHVADNLIIRLGCRSLLRLSLVPILYRNFSILPVLLFHAGFWNRMEQPGGEMRRLSQGALMEGSLKSGVENDPQGPVAPGVASPSVDIKGNNIRAQLLAMGIQVQGPCKDKGYCNRFLWRMWLCRAKVNS